MLCCKPGCIIAMDPENRTRTLEVARSWQNRDGDIEGWVCPKCGRRRVTEMIAGVRKDAKLLVAWDERVEA